jgi:hypothetical protein
MKKLGIVNVNLEFEIPDGQDPQVFLENVELPKEYVADSFEIVKIMPICSSCDTAYDEDDGHSCDRQRTGL